MRKLCILFACLILVGCTKVVPTEQEAVEGNTAKVPLEITDAIQENPIQLDEGEICYGTSCWRVEIADTREERMLGLMMREELASGSGMWFVFDSESPNRKFWMKNTLIPLDMIWADSGYNIVHIESGVPPCEPTVDACPTYGPDENPSLYVLEVNSGTVASLGMQLGESLLFNTIEQ